MLDGYFSKNAQHVNINVLDNISKGTSSNIKSLYKNNLTKLQLFNSVISSNIIIGLIFFIHQIC